MAALNYIENDTLPGLSGTVTDDNGDAVDITGYTITLHINYPSEALVKTASVPDPTNGQYFFTWDEGDLVRGNWSWEVQLEYPSGAIRTINKDQNSKRLTILIEGEIA